MMRVSFRVIDSSCQEFVMVQDAFKRLIEPLYGSQESTLKKIGNRKHQLCEGLFIDNTLKGLLVYRKKLEEEGHALTIKTLMLMYPEKDSRQGFGSILFRRAQEIAKQCNGTKIYLTVPSTRTDALDFFKKKGFEISNTYLDRPLKGQTEYALSYSIPRPQQIIEPVEDSANNQTKASASKTQSGSYEKNIEPSRKKRSYDEANITSSDPSVSARNKRLASGNNYDKNTNSKAQFFPRGAASKQHTCTLKAQYIRSILDGQKSYEGRVNTAMFKQYKKGDKAVWFAGNLKIETEITDRKEYRNFGEMLKDIGYEKMVPEAHSLEHAISLYNRIPGYQEKAARCGVVALGLRVCEPHVQHDVKPAWRP